MNENPKAHFFRRIGFSGIGVCPDTGIGWTGHCWRNGHFKQIVGRDDGGGSTNGGRCKRRFRQEWELNESGSNILEFALALPIMVGLILWLISIGFLLYSQGVVSSAAREAARHAAIHGSAQAESVAGDNLRLAVPRIDEFTVTVEEGEIVTATVVCKYQPFVDFGQISRLFGGDGSSANKTISARAHYRNEKPPGG